MPNHVSLLHKLSCILLYFQSYPVQELPLSVENGDRRSLLLTVYGTFSSWLKHKEGEIEIRISLTYIYFLSSFHMLPVKRKKNTFLVFKNLNHITLFTALLSLWYHLSLWFTFTKASICYVWFIAIIFSMSLGSFLFPL